MPIAAGKIRVLIATTNGPVEVLLLAEEDAAVGRCVACIGGTTETADIAAAYHAFVVRPTGVIESRFGHSCYRLDVSGRIDAGASWQLGILAAHALYAAGRLADENDTPDGVLWATGSVRPVDLTVGGVSHVAEKLASSEARLAAECAAGRRVLLALPAANAAELPPALAAEFAARRVEVVTAAHVDALFDRLGMTLPDPKAKPTPTVPAAAAPVPVVVPAPARAPRRRYAWGAAALVLLGVSGAVLFYNRPTRTADATPPPPGPVAPAPPAPPMPAPPPPPERAALVPEAVPYISAQSQAKIRDEYLSAADYKAVATSYVYMTFVTGQPDQKTADDAALAACEQRVAVAREAAGLRPVHSCEVYASGNLVVSHRQPPPMPPAPWVIRNPAVERPFVAAELPLVSAERKARIAKIYPTYNASKAYVIAPNGVAWAYGGEPSPEEAMRRSLERCGFESNSACMVIALENTFVVPVPTLAKAVGFYHPDALIAATPGVRDDVARRLANATSGWNAVALGAGGQAGIRTGGGSEKSAVEGALEDCGKRDRDCRIAVIGPFLVEPAPDRPRPAPATP